MDRKRHLQLERTTDEKLRHIGHRRRGMRAMSRIAFFRRSPWRTGYMIKKAPVVMDTVGAADAWGEDNRYTGQLVSCYGANLN
tara:strand:- start:1890 stop:2138 length:249 start_codon:yes stop_codon:yes gene_type:complete